MTEKEIEQQGTAQGISKPKPKPKTKGISKRIALKEELVGLSQKLNKDELAKLKKELEDRETNETVETFFSGLFGKGTKVTTFLTGMATWVLEKVGLEDRAISQKEFEEKIKLEAENASSKELDIEEYVVAHRSGGYGSSKENSPEAIMAALDAGEGQIEFDVRMDGDELYVEHDPIDSEKNPANEKPKLDEVLEIFAKHEKKDAALFIDIKEKDAARKIISKLQNTDNNYQNTPGYIPLLERSFMMAFNPEALEAVHEINPNIPLIFHYYPTAKYPEINTALSNVSDENVVSMCESIDTLTLGATNFADNVKNVSLHVNETYPPTKNKDAQERAYIYTMLPDPKILAMIKRSNGYISVPLQLVTSELISEAKKEGVKIAIMGVDSEYDTQMAVALGADMIFSNTPNIIN